MSMKNYLIRAKMLLLSFIKQPKNLFIFFKYIRAEEVLEVDTHIKMGAKWLLNAQKVGFDSGYSRGFYLYKDNGWDKSYIETTGYIIPTFLDIYDLYKDETYKKSALDAGLWLLEIQTESGAYTDIDSNKELVFDTGQVLYGLISIYERDDIDEVLKSKYKEAIYKASSWLCKVQDEDGSWSRYGYYNIPHSYYSRVSSILYKAGILLENESFKTSASKHIKWVLSTQKDNGFFMHLNFTPNERTYVLHSIIYVLEGLYEYYIYTKDAKVLDALLKNANVLKSINLKRDILLFSRYDENFTSFTKERCITGLAQWSNLSFKLYELTSKEDYLLCARKTLYYLKAKQFKEGKNIKGALPGSIPFWGYYAPFSAVNWGVKFYLDALVESKKYDISKLDESRLWIGESFKFENDVVNDEFSFTARKYIDFLDKYIGDAQNVLDLGCGRGRYIKYFSKKFTDVNIFGIDPVFANGLNILDGDVYDINFDKKFDLIYTIEVLQHVKYLDIGLKEIYDKLTEDGLLIICDRDPLSVKGFIKPLLEISGKWMYQYDSPYNEKWYSLQEWRDMLNKNGFKVEKTFGFRSSGGKLGWINKYNIIVARKING